MTEARVNARVRVGGAVVSGRAIVIHEGRIEAIVGEDEVPGGADEIDLRGQTLVPGFIDTQVKGGGDRLFNDDPSEETIRAIGAAHRSFGTTGFLPTLISDDAAKIEAAMDAAANAIAGSVPGVLGVHIEGPFLNPAKRGIHEAAKLRTIGDPDVALLSRPTGGKTIVTLAPETVPADAIRRLANWLSRLEQR